jgi:hypothetical protein
MIERNAGLPATMIEPAGASLHEKGKIIEWIVSKPRRRRWPRLAGIRQKTLTLSSIAPRFVHAAYKMDALRTLTAPKTLPYVHFLIVLISVHV